MAQEKNKFLTKNNVSTFLLTCLVILLVSIAYINVDTNRVQAQTEGPPEIYDNGGLSTGTMSNSGATSPTGTNWSEVQNETGNTTESNTLSGSSCSTTATVFRCADDFIVPTGETWTINNVIVFAYQTGFGGGTSPITAGTLRIWDGVPDEPGSTVLFGDETTNVLSASTDTSLFRIFNSSVPPPGSTPGTTRRIYRNTLNVGPPVALTEGTYWVDWNTQIGTTTGHFAPAVTIPGERGLPGMNARQRIAGGAWQDVIDGGNPASAPDFPLDFPFKLDGTIVGAPLANGDTDFDGDGITDYSVVRDQTPTLAGRSPASNLKSFNQHFNESRSNGLKGTISSEPSTKSNASGDAPDNHGTNLVWYSANSGDGNSTFQINGHGQPGDTLTPADFDGDGIDDIAVWRGVAPAGPMGAFFYVLNSSTSTVDEIDFGQMGDQANIVGDYDGDGKADPAVFRRPATGGALTGGDDLGTGNTFPGTGTGPIPDRGAAGCGLPAGPNLDVSFVVSGQPTAAPASVSLDMNITHTWVGDIDARLIAPDGTEHVIFSSTGSTTATGCGSADDLGGIYTFNNSGTPDWWAQPSPYPVGTYQTTSAGDVPSGGAPTDMDAAFAGIPDQNGTWILRVNDSGGGDVGSISAANLTLTSGAPTGGPTTFFYKGSAGGGETTYISFGDTSAGPIRPVRGDYDGDSKHDFVIYRAIPGAPLGVSTQGQYVILRSTDFGVDYVSYGLTSDLLTPGDFDGDGKFDFMNSRANGSNIDWYLLPNDGSAPTAAKTTFGALIAGFNEFPATGDYDGDGKDDIAVYRRSNTDPDNCFYYILRSSDGMLQTYEFGATTDSPVASWDAQ